MIIQAKVKLHENHKEGSFCSLDSQVGAHNMYKNGPPKIQGVQNFNKRKTGEQSPGFSNNVKAKTQAKVACCPKHFLFSRKKQKNCGYAVKM